MKKIYIHLGFPRTGTTTLQYLLKDEKKIKFFSRNSNENEVKLYEFLFKLINFEKEQFSFEELKENFKKIEFNKEINVISEEGLLCQDYWIDGNDINKSISIFSKILKDLNYDYTFIVVIRNQYDLIKSIYKYFFISYFYKKKLFKLRLLFENKNHSNIIQSLNYNYLYEFLMKEKIKFKFFIYENNYYSELSSFLRLKFPTNIKKKNNKIYSKYIESIKINLKNHKFSFSYLFLSLNLIRKYFFLFLKEIFLKLFFYENKVKKNLIKKAYLDSNKELSKFLDLPKNYFF